MSLLTAEFFPLAVLIVVAVNATVCELLKWFSRLAIEQRKGNCQVQTGLGCTKKAVLHYFVPRLEVVRLA